MQQLAPRPSLPDWPPYGPVSLWVMLRFYASKFVKALDDISAIRGEAVRFTNKAHLEEGTAASFIENLRSLDGQLGEMKLLMTQKSVQRLLEQFEVNRKLDDRAEHLLSEVTLRIQDELDLILLFALPDTAELYEQTTPIFGAVVEAKFPRANYDISEAGKCLALRRSTATVFHLMRVMEVGVDSVGKCLGIPDPVKASDRSWGAIIRKVNEEITRRSRAQPPLWKDADAAFFTEVNASLDAVKRAWRNPTMHVERKYTEEEAEDVMSVVKGFMRTLASRLDEGGQPLA